MISLFIQCKPLNTTIVVYIFLSSLLTAIGNDTKAFKHQYLQMFGLTLNEYMSNFHPLEVVGRGSETQLQVGENLGYII